ncbi:MAG TPA: hypothetical protein VFM68_03260, partial [Candidatus Saccharimonadales bacterium]|nr:hypothetical protein [Candidatus Saccharimonadales bacterium]
MKRHMQYIGKSVQILLITTVVVLGFFVSTATAARLTSPNYQLDANLDGSFGGTTTSTNYKMTSTGGEAIVGNGASGSYKLTQSYDTVAPSIEVSVVSADVFLGAVTSGASNQVDFDINVLTNATQYNLAIHQNHDLQTSDVSATIPAI